MNNSGWLGINQVFMVGRSLLLLFIVFLAACDKQQKPAEAKVISLVYLPCEGSDHALMTSRCGRFYPDPTQPAVYISFAILQLVKNEAHLGPSKLENQVPVAYFSGGPGDGGNTLADKLDTWRYWLLDAGVYRPFILWDSRGNKGSWGYFECEAYRQWAINQLRYPEFTENNELERVSKCLEQWQVAIDQSGLLQFNSMQNAEDVIKLFDALGYEQWHLAATSYGARIAQIIAQKKPGQTLSLILDSPYSWTVNTAAIRAANWKMSYLAQFNYCQQHQYCHGGEQVESLFWRVINKLDKDPLRIGFSIDGYRAQAPITSEAFAHIVFSAFYNPESLSLISSQHNNVQPLTALVPMLLEILDGSSPIFETIALKVLAQSYSSEANPWLYWVVECNDNQTLDSATYLAEIKSLGAWSRFLQPDVSLFVCQLPIFNKEPRWQLNEAVNLSIPAIILTGSLDPVASIKGIQHFRQILPVSIQVNAVEQGHGLMAKGICGTRWYSDFWYDPNEYIGEAIAEKTYQFIAEAESAGRQDCQLKQ